MSKGAFTAPSGARETSLQWLAENYFHALPPFGAAVPCRTSHIRCHGSEHLVTHNHTSDRPCTGYSGIIKIKRKFFQRGVRRMSNPSAQPCGLPSADSTSFYLTHPLPAGRSMSCCCRFEALSSIGIFRLFPPSMAFCRFPSLSVASCPCGCIASRFPTRNLEPGTPKPPFSPQPVFHQSYAPQLSTILARYFSQKPYMLQHSKFHHSSSRSSQGPTFSTQSRACSCKPLPLR